MTRPPLRGRQLDQARAVEHQQESAADHVARLPIALPPVPCFTELVRQSAAAVGRMGRDELTDELDVAIRDRATTIACDFAHGLSVAGERLERKRNFRSFFFQPCGLTER